MILDSDSNDFEALAVYSGPDRVIHSDEMREIVKNEKPKRRVSIGLGKLDNIVGGIEAGELIAIGGPTKHGKTLLCQTLTRNIVEAGGKVIWFSFEVPVYQFLQQMPEGVGFYCPSRLETKNLEWVFKRITESKIKFGTNVVFIDNLHHLVDLASARNVALDIGVVIRQLKRIAIAMDVTIFILCHSRKPSETKGALPEVSEWDLRDSSFIPQEADSTWMVQRKMEKESKRYLNKSFVKVCNHRRNGVIGEVVHLVKVGLLLEEDVSNEC